MAAKGKIWLGEFWRSLAALLLWVLGMVPLIAAPPLLPSLVETRVGGLQPSAEIIAPADLPLSLELHRACGPPLYDLASDCSVAAKSGTGRGGTKLTPNPAADGPHTTFKRDPTTGKVTSHAEWDANGNPVQRVDVTDRVSMACRPDRIRTNLDRPT